MSATLQREHWNGQPTYLGDLFRVSKMRGEKQLGGVCQLWTHVLGWECVLKINDDLQRSEVFRSQDDVHGRRDVEGRHDREEVDRHRVTTRSDRIHRQNRQRIPRPVFRMYGSGESDNMK